MPVFDESARGTHAEDFQLLNYGHVHLVRNDWARDRLVADLRARDYMIFTVDLTTAANSDGVRGVVIDAVPDWPTTYGRTTWPGFTDGLTDHLLNADRQQVVLVLAGLDTAITRPGNEVVVLLDLLASVGRWHLLFGRRLICLVDTDDPDLDLPPLGAEHVRWSRHEFLIVHRNGARLPRWITGTDRQTGHR
jgi:hypothetical protein